MAPQPLREKAGAEDKKTGREVSEMPQVDLSQAVEGLESAAGTVGGFSALEVSGNVAVNVFLLLLSLVFYASHDLRFVPILLGSALVNHLLARAMPRTIGGRPRPQLWLALGLLACTAYLVDGTYNPFLYFRF